MSWVPSSYEKKNKREKKKEKKRVEEISQDERKKIREDRKMSFLEIKDGGHG